MLALASELVARTVHPQPGVSSRIPIANSTSKELIRVSLVKLFAGMVSRIWCYVRDTASKECDFLDAQFTQKKGNRDIEILWHAIRTVMAAFRDTLDKEFRVTRL